MGFGQFVHQKRRAIGLTLREFCKRFKLDVGNISKIERGKLPPPLNRTKLEEYARHLGIEENSEDWNTFFDLASIDAGRLPEDIRSDENIISALPMLFRTLRGKTISDDDLDKIIEIVRKAAG